ncbi:hypothetical protein BGZ57DRAFT_57541 [Hyaloscypha finlandica]|nr:hypothetical protein BGZ57DRAFT_57541 [Hyaloscypha finlandica]
MADDAGASTESDVTENRKPRDPEIEHSPVKGVNGKVEEEVQGSNTERVQSSKIVVKKDDEKKPSKIKEMWGKLELDMGTVMMMFKGSLAPVIGKRAQVTGLFAGANTKMAS